MNKFKFNMITAVATEVKDELGCSLVDAVSKLQATAARNNNEALLSDLCEYKCELIQDMQKA